MAINLKDFYLNLLIKINSHVLPVIIVNVKQHLVEPEQNRFLTVRYDSYTGKDPNKVPSSQRLPHRGWGRFEDPRRTGRDEPT